MVKMDELPCVIGKFIGCLGCKQIFAYESYEFTVDGNGEKVWMAKCYVRFDLASDHHRQWTNIGSLLIDRDIWRGCHIVHAARSVSISRDAFHDE